MADPTAGYSLLPWVRRGLASQIQAASAVNFATLPLSIAVNGAAVAAPPHVRLPGPGDVKSLDGRAFVRTEPRDGADAFEPNYLAAVELATSDLPWMLTPDPPAGDRLRPWICLVVVPDGDGVSLTAQPGGLSVLRLDAPLDPAAELPDLDQIDSWAHAQVMGAAASTAVLAGDTPATVSRLISPRRLEPSRRYLACVVPTFRAGVHAGLGLPVTDDDRNLAWDAAITAPFSLPVYFHFRFQTGPGGDFASLARRIGPPDAPVTAGTRTIDVSAPGFGAAPAPGVSLGLEGALRTFGMPDPPWPADAQPPYQAALRAALAPAVAADPVLAPPTFGASQTGQALPKDGQPPIWMSDLNLDPRHRLAASAGGQVVQADAEAMVASAWDQLGEIRKANQLLRQAQLAREVAAVLHGRLQQVSGDGAFLQMMRPAHGRVSLTLGGATATLAGHVAASRVPAGAVSAALRRIARPRGPIGRAFAGAGPARIVERLNMPTGSGPAALAVAGPVRTPAGMVALGDVSPAVQPAALNRGAFLAAAGWQVVARAPGTPPPTRAPDLRTGPAAAETAVAAAPRGGAGGRGGGEINPVGGPPLRRVALIDWGGDVNVPRVLQGGVTALPPRLTFPEDRTDLTRMQDHFRSAAAAVAGRFGEAQVAPVDPQPLGGAPALAAVRTALSARLDPATTITARLGARVPLGDGADALAQLSGAPAFPQAMYAPLVDLSPEWMLPGISSIPTDTAVLLQTNARFVEAYMVGLNEALARELLWREFPAERRQTWFQNFWDADGDPDIPRIAAFDPLGGLGTHTQDHAHPGRIALLVRASLFQRYPNVLVSAAPAVWTPGGQTRALGTSRQWPIFQGRIGEQFRFFGFDIDDPLGRPDPAAGDAGWYFVLEEHVAEPRFGLEPSRRAVANGGLTWNDLSWEDVVPTGAFLDATKPPAFAANEPVAWSRSAAAMAFILMRRPVRVAMHATALLGGGSGG
ncbi:hypothetical protein [Phenylobacterium sp.]|uniref:hypothetical protein n=1 Tax=Phenylobacterium sp. TaxID=1871053 RepID=UPI0025E746C2|nr:hypothetical protein [Phenylobacterium sp.]